MGQYRAWIEAYGLAYLGAAAWTLNIALASFVCALAWGGLLFFLRLRGGVASDRIVSAYVQLFRNTPVLLPIYLIYFGFPLFGFLWPAAVCGGIALVLQNGAYVCEIFRGAYKAIDRVQHDAAKSLGLLPWAAFRKVTLPQILVHSIPALGNQAVLLLKDTSLLSAVTVVELTMQSKVLTERTGAAYAPFVIAAVFYLAMVSIIELAAHVAHRSVKWK
jgi:His/Glu/Gln/Arg/opine family amino acid ABC transporter permease subunit